MLAKIVEPVSMLTDFLMASQCLYYSQRLIRPQQRQHQMSRALMALSFLFSAIASISAGSNHGFAMIFTPDQMFWSWKISVLSVGLTSFFLLVAVAKASVIKKIFSILMPMALAKLCIYLYWMWSHDNFIYVIANYAPTLLMVMGIQLYAGYKWSAASSKYIVWGVIISFGAAGLQMTGLDLYRYINHNVIYHVVQMLSFYLFYRGSRCLMDSVEPI